MTGLIRNLIAQPYGPPGANARDISGICHCHASFFASFRAVPLTSRTHFDTRNWQDVACAHGLYEKKWIG
jgi:hypothetical protein